MLRLLLTLSLTLLLLACSSDDIPPPIVEEEAAKPKAEVVISFDDALVNSWHANRDIFNNFNVKVTFFITRFGSDIVNNPDRKVYAKFQDIVADGHEIAFHGTHHSNARTLFDDGWTFEDYYKAEIEPAMTMMKEYGLNPTTFAYPYGRDVPEWTEKLKATFARVRDFTSHSVDGEFYVRHRFYNDDFLKVGFSIDQHKLDFDELALVLDDLAQNGGTLVLATHLITESRSDNQWSISRDDLIELLSMIQNRDISIVTFKDASFH
ncbi:polysaccharide deacetylase family protein [Pseudidiomarina salilacus]|uniref:polysaccharide deacetylase family protein n=1 Tax=Pseudidiomarina salilacus TaxID=3384452 RepID=UPI0039853AD8